MFNVIIVDDEPMVLQHLPEMFDWKALNFEIAGKFTSAEQALSFIAENKVHVAIADISMPDMDGIEFARICHEKHPDVIIVFFSAYREFEYAQKAISYGVFSYLTKPISFDEFNAMLESLNAKLLSINSNEEGNEDSDDIIQKSLNFMKKHYAEEIGLEDIAKEVCLNPAYFSVRYKQVAGESVITTLNKIRIENAKKLLKEGIKPYAIHSMVGYGSYSYFYKVFKALSGVTPTEYKEQIRK